VQRALYLIATLILLPMVVGPLMLAFGLERFELRPIAQLMGWTGVLVFGFLWCGALWLSLRTTRALLSGLPLSSLFQPRGALVLIVAWLLVAIWAAQWLLLSAPLNGVLQGSADTAQLRAALNRSEPVAAALAANKTPEQLYALQVMAARVRVDKPPVFAEHPFWSTLQRYSDKYAVDPRLLLYWAYSNSFWGEAEAGRVPFLRAMTPETFRDFVQVHLPAWFIEAGWRRWLIESGFFRRTFGDGLGTKLTYAVQKATYDVSMEPYETELYSDLFVVVRKYESEFPELSQAQTADPLRAAFRRSYLRIRADAVVDPCENAYEPPRRTAEYYAASRDDLIAFARAAFYLFELDFDFATRVQALVARHLEESFRQSLGEATWAQLSAEQRATLLGMLTDIYMPNIGHLGYNVYTAVELQCTPLSFVQAEASGDVDALLHATKLWRPANYEVLWSGAGNRLRLLSEVWSVAAGAPLAGFNPTETLADAEKLLAHELD